MRVFVSWSGGKDSCLALYRAMKMGLDVVFLFTMLSEDGVTSSSHGLSREVLDAQAKSLGISTAYGKASKGDYEQQFKKMVLDHEIRSIQGGVFGDINLQEHRDWIEKVCGETGIKPFLPLWHDNYDKLLNDFIGGGFEAIVVSANASLVEECWIGHPFDWEFVRYLESKGLDRLGEKGEFHTLVTNGPIFKQPLKIIQFSKTMRNNQWIPQKLTVDAI